MGLQANVRSVHPHKGFIVRKHESTTPESSVPALKLRKVFRFRMRPTTAIVESLSRTAGARRFVWNWALAQRREYYDFVFTVRDIANYRYSKAWIPKEVADADRT
jgi:hypothetical protein